MNVIAIGSWMAGVKIRVRHISPLANLCALCVFALIPIAVLRQVIP